MIASGPGSRNVADVTSVPRRIVDVSRARPASVVQASVGPGQAAGLERAAHRQVVVAAEEGAEAELLGALGDGEEVVVGRALLGLGEDPELVEREHRGGPYWAALGGRATVGRRCRDRAPGRCPPPFDALRDHVLAHSVKRGDFTLKSGATSSWFLDTKQTACRPEGIVLVADAALSIIPDEATAIGGLTMGADPVAFGVAAIAATRGRGAAQLQRAQGGQGPRRHRPPRRRPQPGDRVVITEDTVTRGTSLMEAVEVVRAFGAEPVLITVIVDRGGTCAAMAEAAGIAYRPLLTAARPRLRLRD